MVRRSLPTRSPVFRLLRMSAALATACSMPRPGGLASSEAPTAPTTANQTTDHGLQLMPVVGSGAGIVNDTATANGGVTFGGQVNIKVPGVTPGTLPYVPIPPAPA